ncbi:uncharacterized protein LOC108034872 [Drosophila biarmipes]|uniref:uncharacterized protein LOC108034872 n=1 Tax=Drosophila biarmipes TaxID=125945 RepID=UPI0007E6A057|nr:uncharacterized protein LOC108034872 [Drosophila biarmipes]
MPNQKVMGTDRRRNNSHASLLLTTSSTHVQHVGSRTSLHQRSVRDAPSARDLSGSGTRDEHDQNSSLLSNDFVLMLDCAPSPEEVFCEQSADFRTAWLWFNKLTTMHCNTLYDLRMRNAYMSHFIVCLNQKRLTGVFEEAPPEELVWVNFLENQAAPQSVNHSLVTTAAAMQRSCELTQSSQAAPASTSSCGCSGHRTSEYWGSFSGRHSGGTTETSPKSPILKRRRLLRSVPTTSDEEMHQIFRNNRANFSLNRSSTCTHLTRSRSLSSPASFQPRKKIPNAFRNSDSHRSPEEARKLMVKLMELIRKELRGEPDLESKDILEAELKRYRQFFEQHLQDNSDFESHLEKNSNSERVHLLLNMQTDLIRMLKEDLAL